MELTVTINPEQELAVAELGLDATAEAQKAVDELFNRHRHTAFSRITATMTIAEAKEAVATPRDGG